MRPNRNSLNLKKILSLPFKKRLIALIKKSWGFFVLFFLFISSDQNLFCQTDLPDVDTLQQRLREDPSDINSLLSLAVNYTASQDYKKAVEIYFRLLKVDPNNFHAYHNLGIIYKKFGQLKESLECYNKALSINPKSPTLHYNMGLAYEAMGRMQEAREAYGTALSLNPDFSQALDRLDNLSDDPSKAHKLPEPPTKLMVADSSEGSPKEVNFSAKKNADATAGSKSPKPSDGTSTANSSDSGKKEESKEKTVNEKNEKSEKVEKKKSEVIRTIRQGPGTGLYNKAMDCLEKDDLPAAIEAYCRCILKDRDFLAEPDFGLIQNGIALLKDRPNSHPDGFFFRGYLESLTGNNEAAAVDLKIYLEKSKKGTFCDEAKNLVEEEARRQAAFEARKKEEEDAKKNIKASAPAILDMVQTPVGSFTPRPPDVLLKKLSAEEILNQAKQLSREGRIRDSLVVLKAGFEKEPENLQILNAIGNAYTDLMLQQNDSEAGKMAREIFEKIINLAPPDSKEAKIAGNMIKELSERIK
ncbi:MAG: tetratricopeptide repeat protein [Candidatus Riflebacteria bacterium]|nr:tetratricopeptide repeat protein [Candidatus Riflebacteria bacterium]